MGLVIERDWSGIIGKVGKNFSKGKYSPIHLKGHTIKCNSTYNKSFHTIAKLHYKMKQPLCCYICKTKPSHIEYDGTLKLVFRNGYNATIEHVQPKSRNGKDHIDNYKIACFNCNTKRGNIPIHNEALLRLYVRNHKTLKPLADKVSEVHETVLDLTKIETYGRLFNIALKSVKTGISNGIQAIPNVYIVKNTDEYDYYHS